MNTPGVERILLISLAMAMSCTTVPDPAIGKERVNPVQIDVDDSTVSSWDYRHEMKADLDGDDFAETLILASDASVSPGGDPLWEDGHRWVLLVEDGSARTTVYAAFVPHGHLEVAISHPASDGTRTIAVLKRTPFELQSILSGYAGPGRAHTISSNGVEVDRWFYTGPR